MFERWKTESSVEEIDLANTPVAELPVMIVAQEKFKAALAELESANQVVRELRHTLSTRNNETNAVAILQARGKWSQATLEQEMAEKQSRAARRELERVRDLASQRIADARIPARKPLMGQLFEQLDRCVELAEDLRRYDDETQQLSGSRPEAPCPELLPGWSGGENATTYRKRYFRGWLA